MVVLITYPARSLAGNIGMSDLPSVAARDSVSQSGVVDVDLVGLTATVMRPFEQFVSNSTMLPPSVFMRMHTEVMAGLCRLLQSYDGSPIAPFSVPADGFSSLDLSFEKPSPVCAGGFSSSAGSSESASSRRRRRRRASRSKRAMGGCVDAAGGLALSSATGTRFLGVASVLDPQPVAFGDGHCYLQFAAPGWRGKLSGSLGANPTLVKLLAAPLAAFDVRSFSGLTVVRSLGGDWHVEERVGDRPSALAVLRRFVDERLAGVDLGLSQWRASLACHVVTCPPVMGSFEVPALGDRVGARTPALFPAVESSLVPADVPAVLASIRVGEFAAPPGYSFLLFRLFLSVLGDLEPLAAEVGLADACAVVRASLQSVNQFSGSLGGDAVLALVSEPATMLVVGTKMVSNLKFYFSSGSAIAPEIVAGFTGELRSRFGLDFSGPMGRVVVMVNEVVLRCYALLMVVVDQVHVREVTRARCESLTAPLVEYYGRLLVSARLCAAHAPFDPYESFSSLVVGEPDSADFPGGPVLSAVAARCVSGTVVETVSQWVPGAFAGALCVAHGGEEALSWGGSTGSAFVSLSAAAGQRAAVVVYCADRRGRETDEQVVRLLSVYTRRLVVVASVADSALGRFLGAVHRHSRALLG